MKRLPRYSDKPFGDALLDLMDHEDLTYRALSERTARIDGRGVSHATLNMMVNGHDRPTIRVMELVAGACRIKPDYFAEWRMSHTMESLDPNKVGFEQALSNLNRLLGR